jgi:hypothetical protein
MGLRDRPRIRRLLSVLSDKVSLSEDTASLVPHLENADVGINELVSEQWNELYRALAECRKGNLGRWALILYEHTIDPMWCRLKAEGALPSYMLYGVEPWIIGSTTEEIEGFHAHMLEEERARGAETI